LPFAAISARHHQHRATQGYWDLLQRFLLDCDHIASLDRIEYNAGRGWSIYFRSADVRKVTALHELAAAEQRPCRYSGFNAAVDIRQWFDRVERRLRSERTSD
jgi:hypothetical protein